MNLALPLPLPAASASTLSPALFPAPCSLENATLIRESFPEFDVDYSAEECRFVTTLDPALRVTVMSAAAVARFGGLLGRTLIAAEWVEPVLGLLRDWQPHQRHLDLHKGIVAGTGTGAGAGTGAPQKKLYLQLFPMFDPKVAAAAGTAAAAATGAGAAVSDGSLSSRSNCGSILRGMVQAVTSLHLSDLLPVACCL